MRFFIFSSWHIRAPPSIVLYTLVAWKLNVEISPDSNIDLPFTSTPNACAASYITFNPYLSAISCIRFVSHGLPYTCTGIIAVVWGVMAASILSGSILHVWGSMSTKTGLMLFHHKECVVATKL